MDRDIIKGEKGVSNIKCQREENIRINIFKGYFSRSVSGFPLVQLHIGAIKAGVSEVADPVAKVDVAAVVR